MASCEAAIGMCEFCALPDARVSFGIEGVRMAEAAARNIRAISFDVKDVSTLPAHPKEGEHAARKESAFHPQSSQWRESVRTQKRQEENDNRHHVPSPEKPARQDYLQCTGANAP
jgi:hypothetical protein